MKGLGIVHGWQTGPIHIEIDPSKVLGPNRPEMHGSCIEDVNHEIYGGLYAQQIFGESFEEPAVVTGPAGWRAFGGDWKSDGGVIHGTAGDGPKLNIDHDLGGEASVEADVRIDEDRPGNAGLLVRTSNVGIGADNFDGYEISLDAHEGRVVTGRHVHDFQPLPSMPIAIKPHEWHRLRVELIGFHINISVDGHLMLRLGIPVSDRVRPTGGFALRTWQVNASFRNVSVNGHAISPELRSSGVSGMWDAIGEGSFRLDDHAFNGEQGQEIDHGSGSGRVGVANRGLNRWGIAVRRGLAMPGRVYVHGDVGFATVSLESVDGKRTYATQRIQVGSAWAKQAFRLTPSQTDPNARFAITIDRPGHLFVDQATLLCGDRFAGLPIRGDLARGLVAEGLHFLRYGGTMVNVPGYRWKNMIGDPDRRPPYRGNWYPYSTNGFGIFDFLNFCEAAHFGSAFAINIEEMPQDAADLADYLTAPVSNPWGHRRAVDGHPAPYRPEYIEIGNEEGIGHVDHASMAHYAERFRLLSRAILARNRSLKLVCAAWWEPESPDMKTVFDAVNGVATAWDFHVWCDDPNAGAEVSRTLVNARDLFHQWDAKTTLRSVIFEENGNHHDLRRAIGHVTTMNVTRSMPDFVLADCAANCLQADGQNDNGWDQGQLFYSPDRVWYTDPSFAQTVLSFELLPLTPMVRLTAGVSAYVSMSEDRHEISVLLGNPHSESCSVSLSVAGSALKAAEQWMPNPFFIQFHGIPPMLRYRFRTDKLAIDRGQTMIEVPPTAYLRIVLHT